MFNLSISEREISLLTSYEDRDLVGNEISKDNKLHNDAQAGRL